MTQEEGSRMAVFLHQIVLQKVLKEASCLWL